MSHDSVMDHSLFLIRIKISDVEDVRNLTFTGHNNAIISDSCNLALGILIEFCLPHVLK